jgi:hypothetical protein
VVRLLLDSRADPNAAKQVHGRTPTQFTCFIVESIK